MGGPNERAAVMRYALDRGLRPVLTGVLFGGGAAAACGSLMRAFVWRVTPWDPIAYLIAAVTLLGVALFACYLPARRAASVNPMTALRID